MKRFFLAAVMLLAAVGFTACDNDDDELYDTLVGRVWVGDMGFLQEGRYPLVCYIYFKSNGFGTNELRYADNGEYLDTLDIRWDSRNDAVYIDYGNQAPPQELRDVYIRRGQLRADLYTDGRYDGPVTLYME